MGRCTAVGCRWGHLGLLVLDGVLAREILLADTISTELMGAGDLLCPWHEAGGRALLANDIRWSSSARAGRPSRPP
jgi:CRP/FNR family cyclic AMP-dependent transcriptional regulator